MQLPVDVKAVIDEAVDIDAARQLTLSVSVLIDETAPTDISAHVRAIFASAASHARVTVGYLGPQFSPTATDDMAVIVAGLDTKIGEYAARIREAGVPVVVATTLAEQVVQIAAESGYPIPEGDIISPDLSEDQRAQAAQAFDIFFGRIAAPDAIEVSASAKAAPALQAPLDIDMEAVPEVVRDTAANAAGKFLAFREKAKKVDLMKILKQPEVEAPKPSMPQLLNSEDVQAFDTRMGEWIIATCREKRLSFALAFPFVARPLSLEAVNATAVQNAGIGVVIFLPGADMPIMTLNQAKMILQVAAAYGQAMNLERAKELLAVVGGAFALRSVARNVAGLVPGLGWAVKGSIGYAGTIAMGRAAIEYFENGAGVMGVTGTALEIKDVAVRTVSSVVRTVQDETKDVSAESDNERAVAVAQGVVKHAAQSAGPALRKLGTGIADSFSAGIQAMTK